MIALDTSAIVAILRNEPEAERFGRIITSAEGCTISALTYVEAYLVMLGRGPIEAVAGLDALVTQAQIEIVPLDRELALESGALWQGAAPCRPQYGRLCGVRAGECSWRAAAL